MTETKQSQPSRASRIPLYYLGFGVLWVFFGTRLPIFHAAGESSAFGELSKDLIFVGLGTLLLFYLIHRENQGRRAAEASIREARELSERIFAASPSATCITLLENGVFIDLNPAFSRLLGYSREELIGRSPQQLGIALGSPGRVELVQEVARGMPVVGEPVEFHTKSGDGRRALVSMNIIDYKGRSCLLSALVDDTERHQAEEARRLNEEQYRSLFEANPLPMWVYDRETLAFLAVNAAAMQDYGYTREEFLGMTIEDIRPPQTVPPLRAFIEELASGQLQGAERLWQHTRRDGSAMDVQIIANDIVAQGRAARLVLSHDVTERLRAESALRESEERLRAIFEQAAVGLAEATMDGRFLRVNQTLCGMLEYEESELIGMGYETVTHPDDIEVCRPVLARLREPGCPSAAYEKRFHTRSGRTVWVHVTLAAVRDPKGTPKHLVAVIEDITRRRSDEEAIGTLNRQLQSRVNRLLALRQIDLAISASVNLDLILHVVVEQATSQLEVDAAAVSLYHPESGSLQAASVRGLDASTARTRRLGEALAGRAVIERRRIHIADSSEPSQNTAGGARVLACPPLDSGAYRGYAALPLIAKGQVRGVLEVFRREPLEPDDDWWEFCDTLADELAIAIDNVSLFTGLQQSNQELTRAYDTTLEGWSRALDLRDRETEGHTQRVTELTLALGRAMDLGSEQLMNMRRGALLHDIGKMGIPDEILLKPGPLTDEEWVVMRRHPDIARELLTPIGFLRPALDIPYCHHEKWCGNGYPRGLSGGQIPLAARIFSVVDVWDALTSDRVYRRAWSYEQALAYIREQSGQQFDPAIVASFEELLLAMKRQRAAVNPD